MVEWGYALEDARDYGVAACWEVITSGCGADIPNVSCLNYPLAVERATEKYLTDSQTFEQFLRGVDGEVRALCDQIIEKHNGKIYFESQNVNKNYTKIGKVLLINQLDEISDFGKVDIVINKE